MVLLNTHIIAQNIHQERIKFNTRGVQYITRDFFQSAAAVTVERAAATDDDCAFRVFPKECKQH